MDREDSLLLSGTKINSIASAAAQKNASKVQDYERILMFFFMNREVHGVKY